ncbi:hypothetical protein PaecuDRAFT_1775 [Paenibacillus curdlanolyticus YK9]|uniref:DUF6760 domain-containing protein n=1 Tax=Paenibacillus curdlanolyticus YK9 TaxID=717606 RepID=E0I824_9BACL|nr:DUF6760 family protein [Paenibacillus curdlanolyticus]EFM11329.1 hypothetical protein PaecuDRAFT_1775 [Paenibacillus curdlanolyticus YK9]
MRAPVSFGGSRGGGVLSSYPVDRLYEEVAFIAYYLHWTHDDIMAMDHRERQRWCEEVSRIHRKVSKEPKNIFDIR